MPKLMKIFVILGNTLSDVAGIGSAFYVELMAEKIGITLPDLQPAQLERPSARWAGNIVSFSQFYLLRYAE